MPRDDRFYESTPEGFYTSGDVRLRRFASDVEELPEEAAEDSDGAGLTYDASGGVEIALAEEGFEYEQEAEGEPVYEFDDNLADLLSENEQTALGMKLWELVEVDLESRRTWEERMLDGLEIIGLQDIPDDAVAFEGAARVTYPGIAEAMVQFQARAMEELMPPEGPVKVGVIGRSTRQREAQAKRVEDYMNYQLMEEDDEYYWEVDDSLLYLPYAGSAFRKVAPDPVTGKTRSRFIPGIDFIVPYWAKSLKTAPRYTHRYSMPYNDYRRAVDSGYFIDVEFQANPQNLNTDRRVIADVSDDRTETFHEEDHVLELYEMTIDWEFDWETEGNGKKYKYPYTITFERETQRVVRIVRCWDENDEKCERDVWFTHEKFLPGLGFYGWGYLHLIGGLGRAASGALRLLLDGSATSSLQGGFKTRDSRLAGDTTFAPGTWTDVDSTAEELAKSFYTPPFKEPSPALFKTLEILVTNVQRFAGTTEARVGDAPATGPVGTMVALIEQSSKIFSGIHKRLHAAKRQEFKLIAKCNWRFMSEETFAAVSARGSLEVEREDFNPDTIDVIPVSDPNIFSSVQRIALAQAVVESVEKRPDLFPRKAQLKAYRNLFKALKVPAIEEYLPENPDYKLDPVAENEAIARGIPVEVYREQDDASHLAIHQAFRAELEGYPPEVATRAIPAIEAHIAAHMAQGYRKRVEMDVVRSTGAPLPPFDPQDPGEYEDLPPDIEAIIAQVVAGSPAIAPPPPPQPPPREEDLEDERFAREERRKDVAFQNEERRKSAAQRAQLAREGVISDLEEDLLAA
jgi:chaperonin GroES